MAWQVWHLTCKVNSQHQQLLGMHSYVGAGFPQRSSLLTLGTGGVQVADPAASAGSKADTPA